MFPSLHFSLHFIFTSFLSSHFMYYLRSFHDSFFLTFFWSPFRFPSPFPCSLSYPLLTFVSTTFHTSETPTSHFLHNPTSPFYNLHFFPQTPPFPHLQPFVLHLHCDFPAGSLPKKKSTQVSSFLLVTIFNAQFREAGPRSTVIGGAAQPWPKEPKILIHTGNRDNKDA